MTRLINAMREGIVGRLIEHTFDARKEEVRKVGERVALMIYNDVFNETTRKRMTALPHGWLPTDNDIQVRAAGDVITLNFNGDVGWHGAYHTISTHDKSVHMRYPDDMKGTCVKVYDAGTTIADEIEDLRLLRSGLHDEIVRARKQAYATLEAVHTVEKLIEQWPEIAPFVDEADKPVPVTAVAIPTQQLNEMFKLPAATNAA